MGPRRLPSARARPPTVRLHRRVPLAGSPKSTLAKGGCGCTIRAMPRSLPDPDPVPYWLYRLECEGCVYYAGIALDVVQRFFQHVFGLGAKFTRARPPLRVLAARAYPDKGAALRAEIRVKALPRARKLAFFEAEA